MRDMPDIREELRPFFDVLKTMLIDAVKRGKRYPPLHVFTYLTPSAQAALNKPALIMLTPDWRDEPGREECFRLFTTFLNRYAESAILSGAGRGTHTWFGDGEVQYVFSTMYLPGYKPWTLAQLYTVVENEVLFDTECCSTDGNVTAFDLPGLWPDGKAPL